MAKGCGGGPYAEAARGALVRASGEIVRGREARGAMAPSLSLPPSHTFGRHYYAVRGPSEPRDNCAGGSNTICNMVAGGCGAPVR